MLHVSTRKDSRPLLPWTIARHLAGHEQLVWQLTRREVLDKLQGSHLCLLWMVAEPLVLLLLYVWVVGGLFGGSFDPSGGGGFALPLYASLVTFYIFSQVLAASPRIVLANPAYVTRVVFPL